MFNFSNRGFTLVQLLVSMSILLVLAVAVFLWIDPLARVGQAKDTVRTKDVNIIASALNTYAKEHNGMMPILGTITTSKRVLCSVQAGSDLTCSGDSEACLVIDDDDFYKYLSQLPYDPDKSSAADSGYYLIKDSNDDLIVGACDPYGSKTITKNIGFKNTCLGGAYGGGHCWYEGDTANVACDTVCSTLGLTCVKNASYGPDIDSDGNPVCQLHQDLGNTCMTACNDTVASGTPPFIVSDTCNMQTGSIVCGYSPGASNYAICPCQ